VGSTNQRTTFKLQLKLQFCCQQNAVDRLADAIKYLREAPVDNVYNNDNDDDHPMDGSVEVHIILI